MPPNKQIIRGQYVSSEKAARAQELRRAMTPAEKRLWQRLRAGRLCGFHFRRQQVIEPYIVDFYCHQAALVIEIDGPIHHSQREYDHDRQEELQALGLRVLRFSNTDVNEKLQSVLTVIEQVCRQRVKGAENGRD